MEKRLLARFTRWLGRTFRPGSHLFREFCKIMETKREQRETMGHLLESLDRTTGVLIVHLFETNKRLAEAKKLPPVPEYQPKIDREEEKKQEAA